MLVVFAIVKAQSTQLDPGPQTFTENTQANQKLQKRDVIIYLTPEQIKAIQGENGNVNSQQIEQTETSEENQEEREQAQQEQEELFQLRSLEEDSEALEEEDNGLPKSIPVEEPNSEEIEQNPQLSYVYRSPQDTNFVPTSEDNYAYLRFYPDPEEQTEEDQPETEESEEETEDDQREAEPEAQSEAQPEAPQQQVFRLVPYETATEKSISTTTKAPQENLLKDRWLRLLEINRSQLRKASSAQEKTTTTTEQLQAEPETTLSKLRLLARNYNQKQAAKNQDVRRKNLLENQKALIQAEARARNAPTQSRKKVSTTKQNQAPLIKRVKVPTPVLVPIPEPFEVKVPHPFPVPFEIFKQSSGNLKLRKAEAKKIATSDRSESDKRATSAQRPSNPTEKTAEVERRRPADDDVEIPSRKKERLTIIRHVWEK
ncbi:unnamed protein product [Parnassius apollo]|uniref:(apollo) hypothetical protein n=1 Tax=Parnassius apollo TaxID=110799 RepID=A0A8S3X729_PARAO|nr:unnamed protein product [Parnassius apollo]